MLINLDKISMLNGSRRFVFGDKMVPHIIEGMTEKLDLKSA